jgi:hypothetical protein
MYRPQFIVDLFGGYAVFHSGETETLFLHRCMAVLLSKVSDTDTVFILVRRYGWDGLGSRSYAEIGDEFGLSVTRVRQRLTQGLRIIRKWSTESRRWTLYMRLDIRRARKMFEHVVVDRPTYSVPMSPDLDAHNNEYRGPYLGSTREYGLRITVRTQEQKIDELESKLRLNEAKVAYIEDRLSGFDAEKKKRISALNDRVSDLRAEKEDLKSRISFYDLIEVMCISGEFVVRPVGERVETRTKWFRFRTGETWQPGPGFKTEIQTLGGQGAGDDGNKG